MESTRNPAAMEDGTKELKRLAIFDYDGTIVSGQSGLLISRYMFSLKLMKKRHASRLIWWGIRYLLHLPHREGEARELVFKGLSNESPEAVDAFMREFHDTVLAPLYRPKAEAEVARCKAEGFTVLIVSATFSMLADMAAEYLKADAAIATIMEQGENGMYTGRVQGDVVEGKAKLAVIKRWADDCFGPGSWEISRAYADHYSDRDLLGSAVHPYAVCPDGLLRRYAKKRGWDILNWRE